MTPQASSGSSARARSTRAWIIAAGRSTKAGPGCWVRWASVIRRLIGRGRRTRRGRIGRSTGPTVSPPVDATLQVSLHLVEVAGERTGRQVFPTAVGEQRHDRALAQPASLAGGGDENRSARRTAEDPFSEDEVAQCRHGV